MASSSHDITTLPDEVVMEILARLPAKSVGRFRCVSRAWRAMLSSDYFVDLHLRLANKHHPQLLLSPVGSSYDGYIYSWRPSPSSGAAVQKLMRDDFGGAETVPLTKPCRGLLLIRATEGGGYFVFNPSTRQTLALPDSEAPLMMAFRRSGHDGLELPFYRRVSYGLGYCATSKAYKIARLFSNYDTLTRCEVLVLDTPSYWRPSAGSLPPSSCSVQEKNPAVFSNGYLHFLCTDGGGITTINISDETFGSLPPPPGFENETWTEPLLTELNGYLCFCYGDPDHSEDLYHIWILLRDGNRDQWTKLCCVDGTTWPKSERRLLRSLWLAPLRACYPSSGGKKKIMFGTGACKVFEVEIDGGRSGGAPEILFTPDDTIVGSCEDTGVPTIGLFEESLVPVGRTMDHMVSSSPTAKAWFDILKWLPTRSVMEMRLVCREWRGMIMSDSFMRSHIVHANCLGRRSQRIRFVIDPRFGNILDMDKCRGEHALQPRDGFVCSQPCHGLNVGSSNFWDFVCNPTIGYHQDMPLEGNDGTFFAGRIGLGFDMEINKHVLVRIIYKDKNMETRDYVLECTTRYVNEKLWHPIDPPSRPIAGTPPTFVDGKIYWMVDPNLGPVSASCEIVAFDVKTDEFEVLQGPPCISSRHGSVRTTILQLHGVLCVACSDQRRNVIDVWMMKEFGIWSLEYHILLDDNLSANTTLLADDPKDGRILLNTGRSLGYYDPKTSAFETIYTMRIDTPPDVHFFPIVCHESLLCPLLQGLV